MKMQVLGSAGKMLNAWWVRHGWECGVVAVVLCRWLICFLIHVILGRDLDRLLMYWNYYCDAIKVRVAFPDLFSSLLWYCCNAIACISSHIEMCSWLSLAHGFGSSWSHGTAHAFYRIWILSSCSATSRRWSRQKSSNNSIFVLKILVVSFCCLWQ